MRCGLRAGAEVVYITRMVKTRGFSIDMEFDNILRMYYESLI